MYHIAQYRLSVVCKMDIFVGELYSSFTYLLA